MLNPEIPLTRRIVDAIAASHVLDPLADAWQPVVRAARDSSPVIKDALSGRWIGHALHPLLTDLPIGSFASLAVLDAASLAGRTNLDDAADLVLAAGITTGIGAAVTGWADWSDTVEGPRTLGLVHGLCNGGSIVIYTLSLAARRGGQRGLGYLLAFGGLGLLTAGGYLGGELVAGMHLGVKHMAEPVAPGDEFVDVASESELGAAKPLRVEAEGVAVALFRHRGEIVAIADTCTHRGGPLSGGTREGDCVRCPWHGSLVRVDDGAIVEGPATFPQVCYETRAQDGRIAVRLKRPVPAV